MISLFHADVLCSPIPCMVVPCWRLCGKRIDCTCQNCFSDGICKCFCCQVEDRGFQQPEAIPPNPPAVSATNIGRHQAHHQRTGSGLSDSAAYSYANPNRVVFSVPGQQGPRHYEIPQSTYGSTGSTPRSSLPPPASNRQHSHTNTAVTTQPHSSALPMRYQHGKQLGDNATGSPLPPHVTTDFTSSPPALPPRGIRSSSTPAPIPPHPRGNFATDTGIPLLADGDTLPIPSKPKSSTITGESSAVAEASARAPTHDTPPPVPPRSPADVLVMSRGSGADVSREDSMQGETDAALLAIDIDDIHLMHQSD